MLNKLHSVTVLFMPGYDSTFVQLHDNALNATWDT